MKEVKDNDDYWKHCGACDICGMIMMLAQTVYTEFNPVDDNELQVEQNIQDFKKAKAA